MFASVKQKNIVEDWEFKLMKQKILIKLSFYLELLTT